VNDQISVDLNEIAIGVGYNGVADMSRIGPEQLEILAQSINFRDSTEILMTTPGLTDKYLDSLSRDDSSTGTKEPGLTARIGWGRKTRRKEG